MELLKQEIAEFKFRDVVFKVRTKATIADALLMNYLLENCRTKEGAMDSGKELPRLFIVGWEGVKRCGEPVPFDYDLIYSEFPAEMCNEMIPALYKFVTENVDVLKAASAVQLGAPSATAPQVKH